MTRKNPVLSAERNREIARLYVGGMLMSDICRRFVVSDQTVYRALRKNGIVPNRGYRKGGDRPAPEVGKQRRADEYTEAEHREMCKRYAAGESAAVVGRAYGLHEDTIRRLLSIYGYAIRPQHEASRKYRCRHDFFDAIDGEHPAYWLGFIAADGNVWRNCLKIGLARKDREHLERFKNSIASEHPVYDHVSKAAHGDHPSSKVEIKSAQLVAGLARHGVGPAKSFTMCWPDSLADGLMRHYIRGLVDGDGCFGVSRNQLMFSLVGTAETCIGVQNVLVQELGCGRTKLYRYKHSPGIVTLRYGGNRRVPRIWRYLYEDATVYLPRKREVALPFL